ncbi:hypothetical protein KM043_013786 [Ampulex compressa]|nr:hypothetical protein KM043_013786 [Ampulex compressa]
MQKPDSGRDAGTIVTSQAGITAEKRTPEWQFEGVSCDHEDCQRCVYASSTGIFEWRRRTSTEHGALCTAITFSPGLQVAWDINYRDAPLGKRERVEVQRKGKKNKGVRSDAAAETDRQRERDLSRGAAVRKLVFSLHFRALDIS